MSNLQENSIDNDVANITNNVVDFIQDKIKQNSTLSDNDFENLITNIFLKITEIKNIFENKYKLISDDLLKFQNGIRDQLKQLSKSDINFIIPYNYFNEYTNLGSNKGCESKLDKFELVNAYNSVKLASDCYNQNDIDFVYKYINPFDLLEYNWIVKDIIQIKYIKNVYDFKCVIYEYYDYIADIYYYDVSFKGTESLIQIIMDLQIKLIPFNITIKNREYNFDLHKGFSKNLFTDIDNQFVIEIILERLSKIINPNQKSILMISSHSLGAAIGTIFTAYLYSDEYTEKYIDPKIFKKVILNNYGEPRITSNNVLTNIFSDLEKNYNLKYNQFINNLDIVHCVPPTFIFSYNHCISYSKFLQLENNLLYKLKSEKTRNGVLIHFIIYLIYLIRIVKHKINDSDKKIITNITIDMIVISAYSHMLDNYKKSLELLPEKYLL